MLLYIIFIDNFTIFNHACSSRCWISISRAQNNRHFKMALLEVRVLNKAIICYVHGWTIFNRNFTHIAPKKIEKCFKLHSLTAENYIYRYKKFKRRSLLFYKAILMNLLTFGAENKYLYLYESVQRILRRHTSCTLNKDAYLGNDPFAKWSNTFLGDFFFSHILF